MQSRSHAAAWRGGLDEVSALPRLQAALLLGCISYHPGYARYGGVSRISKTLPRIRPSAVAVGPEVSHLEGCGRAGRWYRGTDGWLAC